MSPYVILPILCAVVSVTLGAFVFSRNPRSKLHRSFALLCWETTWWQLCWFISYLLVLPEHKDLICRVAYISIVFLPVTYYHYAVHVLDRRKEWKFVRAGYVIGVVFQGLLWTSDLLIAGYTDHWWGYYPRVGFLHPVYLAISLLIVARALIILWNGVRSPDLTPAVRNRNRFAFYSHFIYSIAVVEYAITYGIVEIYPIGVFAMLLAFGITSYAIVRHRLLDINIVLTRVALFTFIYVPLLILPLIGGLTLQPWLSSQLGHRWWTLVAVLEAIFAVGGLAVYRYIQRRAEDRVLAEQRRYQAILRQASQGMTLVKELGRLLNLIVHLLVRKVRIKHAAIYLWDERVKRFELRSSRHWHPSKSPTFGKEDPLVEYLRWHRAPVVTDELQLQLKGGEKELQPVFASLRSLGAAVLVPSFVEDHCKGFLVLGEKVSKALYTTDDLQVFQVLASQAALAIENAEFYEELQRTQADLFQTGKMASLGHMAGGMSHQINNRFHVLAILAGTLRSVLKDVKARETDPDRLQQLLEKTKETLTKIEANSLRGGSIVQTLLKFSRPAGEYKAVAIRDVLQTAKDVVQFRVSLDRVDLVEEVPGNLPTVKGDLNQLADCCFNLISNAYDAIQKKAEFLEAGKLSPHPMDPVPYRGKIQVRAWVEQIKPKPRIVLEIQDNGVGMTPEEVESLFVPFFTTKATVQKGTGLGLYVIHRIMEQHGGSISANSSYGKGSTFTLYLNCFDESSAPEKPAGSGPP